jgi:glc operon protein GlcG
MHAAQIRTRKALTLAGADMVAGAAEAEAMARGARVVIAVVDDGGKPIVLRRLDGAQVASVDVAIDKARTAAVFRRPSKVLEDQVREGRVGALGLAGGAALQGGVPITVADQVVGAIGASGETPDEDEAIALAGAEAARTMA